MLCSNCVIYDCVLMIVICNFSITSLNELLNKKKYLGVILLTILILLSAIDSILQAILENSGYVTDSGGLSIYLLLFHMILTVSRLLYGLYIFSLYYLNKNKYVKKLMIIIPILYSSCYLIIFLIDNFYLISTIKFIVHLLIIEITKCVLK